MEVYINIAKIINIGDIVIQNLKIHQHKAPISKENIIKNVFLVKKILNISLVTMVVKKLNHYVSFSQKWVYIEQNLTKQNICHSWEKMISS